MNNKIRIRVTEYCKNYKVPTAIVIREMRKQKIKLTQLGYVSKDNVKQINEVIYNYHKEKKRRVLIDYELYYYERASKNNYLNNLESTTIDNFIRDNAIYNLSQNHIINFLQKFDKYVFSNITSTTNINILYLEYYLFAYEIPKRREDINDPYYGYAHKQIREIEKNRRQYFRPNNIDLVNEKFFTNEWHYLEIKFIRLYRFNVTDYNKNPYFINEVSHHFKKIFTVWLSTFCEHAGKDDLMYDPFIDNYRFKKYREAKNAKIKN